MGRKLTEFREELVKQIEEAWAQPQPEWARERLRVVRLVAQHELNARQIAEAAGVSRASVFNYLKMVQERGVEGLPRREWKGARKPAVHGAVAEEFIQRLEAGQFRQASDAQEWIRKRTRKTLSASEVELPARLGVIGGRRHRAGSAAVGAGRASLRTAVGDPHFRPRTFA